MYGRRLAHTTDGTSSKLTLWLRAVSARAGILCDGCGANPVRGVRYHCAACPNYDLCEACLAVVEREPEGTKHAKGAREATRL
jgi:hypothetical protein